MRWLNFEKIVFKVLVAAGEPLSIPEIERRLLGRGQSCDTYDVRDAVWSLIGQGRADFTPRRYVIVKNPPAAGG